MKGWAYNHAAHVLQLETLLLKYCKTRAGLETGSDHWDELMEEVCSPRSGRWLCIWSSYCCCLRHSDSPTAEPLNLFRPKSNHYGLNHMKKANTYEVCAGWMGCATLSLANDIDALKVLPGAPRMRRTSKSNWKKEPRGKTITKVRQRQMNPSHNCFSAWFDGYSAPTDNV